MGNPKARAIAFYLPQYHPIKANDEFWGKGFTEWTNVTKAKPLFKGHIQPKLPADLGFYDLRVPEIREQQADLARQHGIEAFCYWHYWFGNGERALESVFEEVLKSNKPDFPFCLGWANESWTGRWHGLNDQILFKQTYPGEKDYEDHFYSVLRAFKDPRYVKVNNKPVFLIYRPFNLPDINQFVGLWNDLAKKEHLDGIYFLGHFGEENPMKYGCSGTMDSTIVDHLWKYKLPFYNRVINKMRSSENKLPVLIDYKSFVADKLKMQYKPYEVPMVISNWDNTPRSGNKGVVFMNENVNDYYLWLCDTAEKISNKKMDERLIFLKSWNEWAEGNYLEPDVHNGMKYLKATKKALL